MLTSEIKFQVYRYIPNLSTSRPYLIALVFCFLEFALSHCRPRNQHSIGKSSLVDDISGVDWVWCASSQDAEPDVEGFALDAFYEQRLPAPTSKINAQDLKNGIAKALTALQDTHLIDDEAAFLMSYGKESLNFTWQATSFPLKKLPIPLKTADLCRASSGRRILASALINRKKLRNAANRIYFLYDDVFLKKLQEQDPFQFSILLHHEWLYSYTRDETAIESFNMSLHRYAVQATDSGLISLKHAWAAVQKSTAIAHTYDPYIRLLGKTWAEAKADPQGAILENNQTFRFHVDGATNKIVALTIRIHSNIEDDRAGTASILPFDLLSSDRLSTIISKMIAKGYKSTSDTLDLPIFANQNSSDPVQCVTIGLETVSFYDPRMFEMTLFPINCQLAPSF